MFYRFQKLIKKIIRNQYGLYTYFKLHFHVKKAKKKLGQSNSHFTHVLNLFCKNLVCSCTQALVRIKKIPNNNKNPNKRVTNRISYCISDLRTFYYINIYTCIT